MRRREADRRGWQYVSTPVPDECSDGRLSGVIAWARDNLDLVRAEELLETGSLPIEDVAGMSGFGTAAALREQFVRRRSVPPRDYRRTFATRC